MAAPLQTKPVARDGDAAPGRSPAPRRDDPFRYGSRLVEARSDAGRTRLREIPLTREDLLDPQEGDIMVHGTLHGQIIRVTAVKLEHWFESRGRMDVAVYDDVKMIWGVPGLPNVAPDIAVISGVVDKDRPRTSFQVAIEGVRPCLVLEVISENTRRFDYRTKPGIYQRAGVTECVLVDPLEEAWQLSGKRLHPATRRYRKVRLDAAGRLRSETTGLAFGIGSDGKSLVVEDVATGERLRDLREAERRADREAAARRELEAKLARLEERLEKERRAR